MIEGQALTLWTIRIAAVLYVLSLAAILMGRADRSVRAAWTLGCLFYLAHVAAAFHFHHDWSHAAAYRETARQTAQVFAVKSGIGLYANYLFTALWIADVVWWWIQPKAYRGRKRWIAITIHLFFAFMFFNGAVVFATGPTRWFGVAATAALAALWLRAAMPKYNGTQLS